ncbi:MAG: hypothetical protein ACTS6G_05725 [Candidatus Hodgkinia cicadicola]
MRPFEVTSKPQRNSVSCSSEHLILQSSIPSTSGLRSSTSLETSQAKSFDVPRFQLFRRLRRSINQRRRLIE